MIRRERTFKLLSRHQRQFNGYLLTNLDWTSAKNSRWLCKGRNLGVTLVKSLQNIVVSLEFCTNANFSNKHLDFFLLVSTNLIFNYLKLFYLYIKKLWEYRNINFFYQYVKHSLIFWCAIFTILQNLIFSGLGGTFYNKVY